MVTYIVRSKIKKIMYLDYLNENNDYNLYQILKKIWYKNISKDFMFIQNNIIKSCFISNTYNKIWSINTKMTISDCPYKNTTPSV